MPYFVSFYVDIQNNKPICMNKFTIDIDETFKYHYRSLCLYVLHYVHDTDIAEDIVQDSFSALWEKLSISWKSHSTLTLLATQNYPFLLKYDCPLWLK